MAQTYIAYADSPNGLVNFSLERGNRKYLGRFVDRNRDVVQDAINAPVVAGDGRNLLLNSQVERTTNINDDKFLSYDSSMLLDASEEFTLSFDAILVEDLSADEPKVTPFYPSGTAVYGTDIPITATWVRYSQTMPLDVHSYSNLAIHSNVGIGDEFQCIFTAKNIKLERGDTATPWTPAPEDMLAELDAKIIDPTSYQWKIIRNSTNADWWSNLGVVRTKAVITMADDTVIEIYDTDYIKSWSVTQDLSSSDDAPVFDFVSDRLEMTLYSLDNDFNPFAENSQYYGKFVLGTRISLFVKVDYLGNGDELNWDFLDEYKVAEIEVGDTSTEVHVLAYDCGYDGIENSKQQALLPLRYVNEPDDIVAFLEDVFPDHDFALGFALAVEDINTSFEDLTINEVLDDIGDMTIDEFNAETVDESWKDPSITPKMLFPLENKYLTMNELLLALGYFAECKGNTINLRSFDNIKRANLDSDNIVTASPIQSLAQQFDDSIVRWNEVGLKQGAEIASLLVDFKIAGEKIYSSISYNGYINRLEGVICTSSDNSSITDVNLSKVYSNALTLGITNERSGEVDVKIRAEAITLNEILEGELDNSKDIYEIEGVYIQTEERAKKIKEKIDQFITTQNKYIDVEILFNPLLQLAWQMQCKHSDYDVDMKGYIVRQTLEVSDSAPAGRHSVTLLNREAVL